MKIHWLIIGALVATHSLAGTFRGRVVEQISDRLDKTTETKYVLVTDSASYVLIGKIPPAGSVVEIQGDKASDSVLHSVSFSVTDSASRRTPRDGETMLVVRLKFASNGDGSPCTIAQAQNLLFDLKERNSLANFLTEVSRGKKKLTGRVHPEFITVNANPAMCENIDWANQAEAQLRAQGIDPASFTRIMYFTPPAVCGIAGTAEPYDQRTWIIGQYCSWRGILAHEYGHNLGLAHAITPTVDYGDMSDVQGASRRDLVSYNAPHMNKLEWLEPGELQETGEEGEYWISPMYPQSSPYPKVVRARLPYMQDDIFLSFRRPIGYDVNLAPYYREGVALHTMGRVDSQPTILHKMMQVGEKHWYEEYGLQIDVQEIQADKAKVKFSKPCYRRPFYFQNFRGPYMIGPNGELNVGAEIGNADSLGCAPTAFGWTVSAGKGLTVTAEPAKFSLAPKVGQTTNMRIIATNLKESDNPQVRFKIQSKVHGIQEKSIFVSVDATPPLPPASYSFVKPGKCRAVKISWTLDDPTEIFPVRMNIYRNGDLVTTVEDSHEYLDTDIPVGAYRYTLRSVDSVGNLAPPTPEYPIVIQGGWPGTCR